MRIIKDVVSCIVLAGGEGRRVGGADKGLLEYKGKPLIEHVVNSIAPQVDDIVISANRNTQGYRHYSAKVISDDSERYLGPLAGINAAAIHCKHDWILVVACDMPFLPADIIEKFSSKQSDADLYIACTADKLQLVILLHRTLLDSIGRSLEEDKLKLMQWARTKQPELVSFQDKSAFKNFNEIDDFKS